MKLPGTCGILGVVVAYSAIALSIHLSPWFSWTDHALSDLGARPPSDIVYNVGLMASSIPLLILGIGFWRLFRDPSGRAGAILYGMCTISLFLVGYFPTPAGKIHSYASLAFFAFLSLSLLAFALSGFRTKRARLGCFALLLAAVSIGVWVATVAVAAFRLLPWKGVAIPEIVAALSMTAWIVAYSAKMLGVRGPRAA